ncbi:MAG: carbamoyltransferase C-terminal domain-containing protein [bacterium]
MSTPIVLGIHAYIHDSGACLISPDCFVAITEERLSRIKYDASFPRKSIEYVLHAAGLKDINDVDLVVFDLFEKQGEITHAGLRYLGYRGEVVSIKHHDSHAASAYFISPFKDAAVLIVDGAGSRGFESPPGNPVHYLDKSAGRMQEVQSIYRATDGEIQLIRRTYTTSKYPMGIGFLYGVSSEFLGFNKLEGGKLMGLAAYGNAGDYPFPNPLFTNFSGEMLIEYDHEALAREDYDVMSGAIFCGIPQRKAGEPITAGHEAVARYVQDQTEEAMLVLAKNLYEITRCENICLSGGVALNGIANKRILDETPFERIFIQPAANDSGNALGCALYGYHIVRGVKERRVMRDAFLGQRYDIFNIQKMLKATPQIEFSRPNNLLRVVAEEIASGKIVGWFEGCCETGPRALGHRSILADPRNKDMKDMLNRKVKHREPFRPYAPAVLEEFAAEYFDFSCSSPFMLMIGYAKAGKAEEIPAVVHVDGSARIQTVNAEGGRFRHLISEFRSLTGVPMVVNTSFNVSGEPIVETPENALMCFLNTEMDLLVIEDFLVNKK